MMTYDFHSVDVSLAIPDSFVQGPTESLFDIRPPGTRKGPSYGFLGCPACWAAAPDWVFNTLSDYYFFFWHFLALFNSRLYHRSPTSKKNNLENISSVD